MAKRQFILRDTTNPDGDLERGWSGNVNAWFKERDRAVAFASEMGALTEPKQCPVSGLWCGDPELGLSGFAFNNEAEFDRAMEKIATYVEWRSNPTLTVFAANDVQNGIGLDGEDVFKDGWVVVTLPYPFTWTDFQSAVAPSVAQDDTAIAIRRAAVVRIMDRIAEEWIADAHRPMVTCRWAVNQGDCVEFAQQTLQELTREFPAIEIEEVGSDEVGEELGLEFGGFHAFLKVEGLYYDAERYAMPDPLMLPFMAGEYRMAMMALKEEELDDEGADDDAVSISP